jgi:hypothetical protein
VTAPTDVLVRSVIEGNIRAAWQTQQSAELAGDLHVADKAREDIDRLLGSLFLLLQQP